MFFKVLQRGTERNSLHIYEAINAGEERFRLNYKKNSMVGVTWLGSYKISLNELEWRSAVERAVDVIKFVVKTDNL